MLSGNINISVLDEFYLGLYNILGFEVSIHIVKYVLTDIGLPSSFSIQSMTNKGESTEKEPIVFEKISLCS